MSGVRPNFGTNTRIREDEDTHARKDTRRLPVLPPGWYGRLRSSERTCLAIINAAVKASGGDAALVTYQTLKGFGLSPSRIKQGIDGLEGLGLVQRAGEARVPSGQLGRLYRLTPDGAAFVGRYSGPLTNIFEIGAG